MSEQSPETKGFFRQHAAKLIASVVITAGVIFTLQKGGLTLVPKEGNFSTVKWFTVPLYLVTLIVMSYFRAVRWRFLLRSFADIPRRRILAVSWIGFAAILLMPFRIGEFVRPYMIREKGKISMTSATGTIIGERVADLLYLSLILALALVFAPTVQPLPDHVLDLPVKVSQVRTSGWIMLGIGATGVAVTFVFFHARVWARKMTLAVFGIVSKKLGEKLADTAEKLAGGLHFLGNGRDALGFLAETTAYWGINALGMWLLAWGCGITHGDGSPITFLETCALMGMLGCTILIPGPPGLLGVFQAGIYAGMVMYFPEHIVRGPGAAFAFLLYLVQLVWQAGAAGFFLVFDRSAARKLAESPVVAGEEAPAS